MKHVIFDWKRTLYDPEKKKLIKGAKELLEHLYIRGYNIYILGKGKPEMMDEVFRLRVAPFCQGILFVPKSKKLNDFFSFLTLNRKETYVIGDRARSEIELGYFMGVHTVWIKQGKFAKEEPEDFTPNDTYLSLQELLQQLINHESLSKVPDKYSKSPFSKILS